MTKDSSQVLTTIFYTILVASLILSLSAMYKNLVIDKNFYQFTVDDERPDPLKPFLYNQTDI